MLGSCIETETEKKKKLEREQEKQRSNLTKVYRAQNQQLGEAIAKHSRSRQKKGKVAEVPGRGEELGKR